MNLSLENLLFIISNYFEKQSDVTTVYLFGSSAKGKHRAHSDVDIAVLFAENMNVLERFERKLQIANQLEKMMQIKVDVVDLESVDAYFAHQILIHKHILKDKNLGRRVDFEVRMRRTYFDMQPFYELYHKQALSRLERMYPNG